MGRFPVPEIIGILHQFSAFGQPYRVLSLGQKKGDSWMVNIQVIETQEELEYPLQQAMNDPKAV